MNKEKVRFDYHPRGRYFNVIFIRPFNHVCMEIQSIREISRLIADIENRNEKFSDSRRDCCDRHIEIVYNKERNDYHIILTYDESIFMQRVDSQGISKILSDLKVGLSKMTESPFNGKFDEVYNEGMALLESEITD